MLVLIGVDDSSESRHAVDTGFEFFGPDADYLIVSVGQEVPNYSASFASGSAVSSLLMSQEFDTAADEAKRNASEAASHLPAGAKTAAKVGHPGRALCEIAADKGADAIVIGSQDKSVWERLLDPSVGRYLIDHAPCPVVVVR